MTGEAAGGERIADYEFDRPFAGLVEARRWVASAPARLDLAPDADGALIGGGEVMVKLIDGPATPATLDAIASELAAWPQAESDALVPLIELGLADGQLFCVSAFGGASTLAAPGDSLSRVEVLEAMARAARAAHALHEVGLVHQDIRPDVIVMTADGARLGEPGLTRSLDPGQTVATGVDSVERVRFLAPELIRGEQPSRASDVWSLGAALHEALTGVGLYPELPVDTVGGALHHIATTDPTLAGPLSAGEMGLLHRCLQGDPFARVTTAQVVAELLDEEVQRQCAHPDADASRSATAEKTEGVDESPALVVMDLRDLASGPITPLPVAPSDAGPSDAGPVDAGPGIARSMPGPLEVAGAGPRDATMVRGIRCSRGHFNDPRALFCMVCGISMVQKTHHLVKGARPALGFLVFDDGSTFTVDRSYRIGTDPDTAPGCAVLTLEDPHGYTVSAVHAELRLDEWSLTVRDLGSTHGTSLWDPETRIWMPVSGDEAAIVAAGASVALGHRTFVFESVHRT